MNDNVNHIEIYYHYEMKDWCGDAIDQNGDYIDNTAEWSATQKLAITRAQFNFPNVPLHVFQKGTEKKKVI
jgi:hypothetical protein